MESGAELLLVASMLLPYVDAQAAVLRWNGKLPLHSFLNHMAEFALRMMVEPPSDALLVGGDDGLAIRQALRRFRALPGVTIGRFTDVDFNILLHRDDPAVEADAAQFADQISRAEKYRRKHVALEPGSGDAADALEKSVAPPPLLALSDRDQRIQALLVKACRGETGCAEDPRELQQQCETFLSSFFVAADEVADGMLAWDELTGFIADSAIAFSSQLALKDVVLFVQGDRKQFGTRTCIFTALLSEAKLVQVVLDANTQVLPELQVVSTATLEVLSRHKISFTVLSIEVISGKHMVACCTELALLFFDTRSWREIGRLGLDALGDTASCVHWDVFRKQLLIGCRSGRLVTAALPQWVARSSSWTAPAVVASVEIAQFSILRIHTAIAEGLLFASTSRGQIHCYDVVADEPKHTMQCGQFGIHLVTSIAYNKFTQYLVCGGEATYLLAWIAPALANQAPIRIEDNVCPHASRVMGIVSDSESAIVASIDNRGIFKIWDLNTLQCTQTKKLAMQQNDFVGLFWFPQHLMVALQKETFVFQVDNEKLEMPVTSLQRNPKGSSVGGAVNRDVIEWSVANGRKTQHHQNLLESELTAMCYAGKTGAFFVLSKAGEIASFALATGKQIAFYERKIMQSEAVSIQFCVLARRLVVTTVDRDVWFFPLMPTPSEHPVKATLAPGDTSCTCLCIGAVEGVPTYFVGTTENSINCFIFRHPNTPKRVARIALHEGEQTTALLYSDAESLVGADTGGNLYVFRLPKCKLVSQIRLCDATVPDGMTAPAPVPDCFVTCLFSYIAGAVFLAGDSCGWVHVLHFSKRHTPDALVRWRAHTDAVSQITVEQNIVFTTAESSAMSAWTLDGEHLLHLWGPQRRTREIVGTRPSWMDAVEERLLRVRGSKIDMSASFASPVMKMTKVVNRMRAIAGPLASTTDHPLGAHFGMSTTAAPQEASTSTTLPDLGTVGDASMSFALPHAGAGGEASNNASFLLRFPSFLESLPSPAAAAGAQHVRPRAGPTSPQLHSAETAAVLPSAELFGRKRVSIAAAVEANSEQDSGDDGDAFAQGKRTSTSTERGEPGPAGKGTALRSQLSSSQLALPPIVIWRRGDDEAREAAEAAAVAANQRRRQRPRTLVTVNHCLGLQPVGKASSGASCRSITDDDVGSAEEELTRSLRGSEHKPHDEHARDPRHRGPKHSVPLRKAPVVTRR